ncbi:MAG: hypothetical protein IH623_09135 [Verrucomicrobia bacterium]|nr:hypothetical protein [Verrucomicrobiota bacterium]
MSYKGTVKNGVIVLEAGVKLAEGTDVRIEAEVAAVTKGRELDPIWTIGELAVPTGISDLATNVDHYLYGHPKVTNGK